MDDAKTVQALLNRGFDPNTPSPELQPALTLALQKKSLKVAEALIAWRTIDVNQLNPHAETPLMMAAMMGHLRLAEQLIARGADVNKTGWTPLHYAATGGHVEMIRLLLEHHAYIDAESPNRTTPLMMAAYYGNPAVTKLLLEEGADLTARVDFAALDAIAKNLGLNSSLITQREFLISLGIEERRKALPDSENSAIDRLIALGQMGDLFKCHILWP